MEESVDFKITYSEMVKNFTVDSIVHKNGRTYKNFVGTAKTQEEAEKLAEWARKAMNKFKKMKYG